MDGIKYEIVFWKGFYVLCIKAQSYVSLRPVIKAITEEVISSKMIMFDKIIFYQESWKQWNASNTSGDIFWIEKRNIKTALNEVTRETQIALVSNPKFDILTGIEL